MQTSMAERQEIPKYSVDMDDSSQTRKRSRLEKKVDAYLTGNLEAPITALTHNKRYDTINSTEKPGKRKNKQPISRTIVTSKNESKRKDGQQAVNPAARTFQHPRGHHGEHVEQNDSIDEYFSDGNTGATKETFKVSKKQLKEQAQTIQAKLRRSESPKEQRGLPEARAAAPLPDKILYQNENLVTSITTPVGANAATIP